MPAEQQVLCTVLIEPILLVEVSMASYNYLSKVIKAENDAPAAGEKKSAKPERTVQYINQSPHERRIG